MAYSQAWLESTSAIRAIFIEAYYYDVATTTEKVVYLSTTGYVTDTADVSFEPVIANNITLQESLSIDGGISFSFGDIEIYNNNGEYDSWLSDSSRIWVNRAIKIYYGDPAWNTANLAAFKTDFLLIFDGIIANIDSKSRTSINLKIRDKMERLNTPITEDKLGTYGTWAGGQSNQDSIKPLVFGEVFNYEPLLIDPSTLQYMFNNGTSEQLIEIRDNGVPIYTAGTLTTGATVSLANGTFTLAHPLAGSITVSAQGVKRSIDLTNASLPESATYNNNIANLIALIVTKFGSATNRLSASDIDQANFLAFSTANTQYVGIVLTDRENVLSVCSQLADSIGAQLYFNRLGKLQLLRLGTTFAGSSVTSITDSDIIRGTLAISNRLDIVAANKVGYAKNWMVQDNLLTGIPEAHKLIMSTEWYSKTATNPTVSSRYKLNVDPVQKDTLLIDGTQADTEATRLKDYFSASKTIYKFTGISRLLSLQLGQAVNLTHSRFDLYKGGAGVSGQVYSLAPNWLEGTIEVEVIV